MSALPFRNAEPGADDGARACVEALLFAASEPMSIAEIAARLPMIVDVSVILHQLADDYEHRGLNLLAVGERWCFRTAPQASLPLPLGQPTARKLSRAALEVLAVCAWHQPVSRAEIEELRGVSVSSGTLDLLLELGFVRMRGRRRSPGRPVTYGTTAEFLLQFGLASLADLPGLDELEAAGLLSDGRGAPFTFRGGGSEEDALGPDLFDVMVETRRTDESL